MTETCLRVRHCMIITGHNIGAYIQTNMQHWDSISCSLFWLTERTREQRAGDIIDCLLLDHYTGPSVMW